MKLTRVHPYSVAASCLAAFELLIVFGLMKRWPVLAPGGNSTSLHRVASLFPLLGTGAVGFGIYAVIKESPKVLPILVLGLCVGVFLVCGLRFAV
jgi:hypothetical protein